MIEKIKNSNREIIVYRTGCNNCMATFFEMQDYELVDCPNCGLNLKKEGAYVEETFHKCIEVDSKTGKIIITK